MKKSIKIYTIAIFIALMLSFGVTMARQQRSEISATQVEVEAEPYCFWCPADENESRDTLCSMIVDNAPLINEMIQEGTYDQGRDNVTDPSPQEIGERLEFLLDEWCPLGTDGDWTDPNGLPFHLIPALAICIAVFLGMAGVPFYVASFVAVNILLGISAYTITLAVILEFCLDYTSQIITTYLHCVQILTGG